jgi:hypothetical protein
VGNPRCLFAYLDKIIKSKRRIGALTYIIVGPTYSYSGLVI